MIKYRQIIGSRTKILVNIKIYRFVYFFTFFKKCYISISSAWNIFQTTNKIISNLLKKLSWLAKFKLYSDSFNFWISKTSLIIILINRFTTSTPIKPSKNTALNFPHLTFHVPLHYWMSLFNTATSSHQPCWYKKI